MKTLKKFDEIQSKATEGNMSHLDDKSGEYFDAMYELSDLEFARSVFEGEEPDGLKDLLTKLVKGPEATRNETDKSVHARNFSFEIVTGARLAATGLRVTFSKSGDVYAKTPLGPFYFQCKRPRSTESLARRIKEAAKQLEVDLRDEKDEPAFGMIAIDATRIINQESKLLYAPTRELSDRWHMRILSDFCVTHIDPLIANDNYRRHRGILGIKVRFAGQWGIQDTGTIHYQHDFLSMHLPNLDCDKLNMFYYFDAGMQLRIPKFQ